MLIPRSSANLTSKIHWIYVRRSSSRLELRQVHKRQRRRCYGGAGRTGWHDPAGHDVRGNHPTSTCRHPYPDCTTRFSIAQGTNAHIDQVIWAHSGVGDFPFVCVTKSCLLQHGPPRHVKSWRQLASTSNHNRKKLQCWPRKLDGRWISR
jgi:hypothetical protein